MLTTLAVHFTRDDRSHSIGSAHRRSAILRPFANASRASPFVTVAASASIAVSSSLRSLSVSVAIALLISRREPSRFQRWKRMLVEACKARVDHDRLSVPPLGVLRAFLALDRHARLNLGL